MIKEKKIIYFHKNEMITQLYRTDEELFYILNGFITRDTVKYNKAIDKLSKKYIIVGEKCDFILDDSSHLEFYFYKLKLKWCVKHYYLFYTLKQKIDNWTEDEYFNFFYKIYNN